MGILDAKTAEITEIGDPGAKFAGITFDNNCNLYGITSSDLNNNHPESLYQIDPATADTTFLKNLFHDGSEYESLAYNKDDNMLYRMSGYGFGNLILQSISLDTNNTYTVTNIPITGDTAYNAYSMIYMGNNTFSYFDWDFQVNTLNTVGLSDTAVGFLDINVKGGVFLYNSLEITNSGQSVLCGGDNTLLNSAPGGNTYQWFRDGLAIAGATSQSHLADSTGSYNCKVTFTGCGSDTAFLPHAISVYPAPVIYIIPAFATITNTNDSITLTASAGASHQWYIDGVAIPGATSMRYVATTIGNYTVEVTDFNGCSGVVASPTLITSSVGIAEVNTVMTQQLIPNPSNGNTTLVIDLNKRTKLTIALYDALGKQLMLLADGVYNKGKQPFNIDGQSLQAGVYIVQIKAGSELRNERLLIIK